MVVDSLVSSFSLSLKIKMLLSHSHSQILNGQRTTKVLAVEILMVKRL